MAGVLVKQGQGIMLEAFVNKAAPQNLVLRLYKTDVTPSEADTEATYTAATFTGYADATLTGASWNAAVTSGDPSYITYAEQTFTATAGVSSQTIYGYLYVQATSAKCVGAERFTGAPYTVQNVGDAIKVTPKFTAETA